MRKNTVPIINSTCTQRIAALKEYVNPKAEVPVEGESLKLSDVIAVFQKMLDAQAAVTAARAELKASLASRTGVEATFEITDQALKSWVQNQFGSTSKEARAFGFEPRKVGKKSVATKMQALEKSKATRQGANDNGGAPAQPNGTTTTIKSM